MRRKITVVLDRRGKLLPVEQIVIVALLPQVQVAYAQDHEGVRVNQLKGVLEVPLKLQLISLLESEQNWKV